MSKTKDETKEGKRAASNLSDWLKKSGNNSVKAAFLLGYKNSATISMWMSRKCVPFREVERVEQLVKGELE